MGLAHCINILMRRIRPLLTYTADFCGLKEVGAAPSNLYFINRKSVQLLTSEFINFKKDEDLEISRAS